MFNSSGSDQPFNALRQAAYQLSSCTDQLFLQIEQQQALDSIISRIRSSLELNVILNTTATEIRQLLNADRVGVFRFTPDSGWDEGEFVAEDVATAFPSAMAAKVYDHCFGSQFATYYTQGRVQAVSDIHNAALSACHIQVLAQFQIRANLIVPVLKGGELWGLLCVHQCSHPRRWQLAEIEFVRKIADHFAIALQQAEYIEQLHNQVARLNRAKAQEKALFKITNRVRRSFGWETICTTATAEVRQLLAADRVAIYRFNPDWSGDFRFESVEAKWQPLVGVEPTVTDTHLMETQGGRYVNSETFAVTDIYEAGYANCHIVLLEKFQARAYVISPIFQGDRLWGLLAAFQNTGPRQWQEDEIGLLAQIAEQLGVALQQADAVAKIEAQSVELRQTLKELQQSQSQLVQNEKMAGLGQMVAGIAHEINNPVNFIYGNLSPVSEYVTDLLSLIKCYQNCDLTVAEDVAMCNKQAENIDLDFILEDLPKTLSSMEVGTERIRQIVLSLRNFSRLDEADFKPVDIHEGIESTLLILGSRIKPSNQPKIEIIKNYECLPLVECYPAQLNQVFMNLLANALDAIEEAVSAAAIKSESAASQPYKVWINTLLDEQDYVEIRIRDNGVGLSEATTSKIFDHFFTTKPVGKGTGLGLSISRKIVMDKHFGTLDFNPALNQGAEFIIRIPAKQSRK